MSARINLLLFSLLLMVACEETPEARERGLQTPYELGDGNTTATYQEILEFLEFAVQTVSSWMPDSFKMESSENIFRESCKLKKQKILEFWIPCQ